MRFMSAYLICGTGEHRSAAFYFAIYQILPRRIACENRELRRAT